MWANKGAGLNYSSPLELSPATYLESSAVVHNSRRTDPLSKIYVLGSDMKILYGVQGTGNGHISRSREIIHHLKARGHEVEVILSGRDPETFWDMEEFEPYVAYKGLTFVTRKGKVDYSKTVLQLNLPRFYSDIKTYHANNLDLVITNFEPITAQIARKHKLPSIGIGHQYAFWYDIPMSSWNLLGRYIIKNYAPADIPLGLHWHHFNQPILPPITPKTMNLSAPKDPTKVLTYLPFETLTDISNLVQPFADYEFYIYHAINKAEDSGNLHFRPFSRSGFLKDLAESSYVICSAGFELVSEALTLGKKILVKPLAGQMEQNSNALALTRLNLGMVMKTLNRGIVSEFLNLQNSRMVAYPDVAILIAQWLELGKWDNVASLAEECWRQVN